MKKFALGTLLAVSLAAFSLPAQADYCERLHWQCEHKYELGLQGEGICHRFHEECQERHEHHMGYCDRLRYQCEHKYELGLEGEGTCRRFREECR